MFSLLAYLRTRRKFFEHPLTHYARLKRIARSHTHLPTRERAWWLIKDEENAKLPLDRGHPLRQMRENDVRDAGQLHSRPQFIAPIGFPPPSVRSKGRMRMPTDTRGLRVVKMPPVVQRP